MSFSNASKGLIWQIRLILTFIGIKYIRKQAGKTVRQHLSLDYIVKILEAFFMQLSKSEKLF